jgi:hypothetical protein
MEFYISMGKCDESRSCNDRKSLALVFKNFSLNNNVIVSGEETERS